MDSFPPSPEERRDRPLTFGAAAIWTLLALFSYVFFVGLTESAREGALFDLVSRTGCLALAYSLVFFGILRMHEPEASIRRVLALRAPPVLAVFLAIAVGAALALPSSMLEHAMEAQFPRREEDQQALERLLAVTTTGKRVALVVTVVVLQPVLDELFFRGALFTPLRRTRRAEMVVVATAAFETLGSLSPRDMISLFAASLVFAWMRSATASVLPSMFARIAFFGVTNVPIALGHGEPRPTKTWLAASAIVAVLGLFGLGVLSRRHGGLLHARLEDGKG